jgi:hypothetical protein
VDSRAAERLFDLRRPFWRHGEEAGHIFPAPAVVDRAGASGVAFMARRKHKKKKAMVEKGGEEEGHKVKIWF